MNLRRALYWAVAATTLAMGALATYANFGFEKARPRFEAVDITGVAWGKDFHLTGHDGKPRELADFRGKVVTLYFGYTQCPDMCPMTMARLADAVRLLGGDAERVQGLFVTVDPKRDTPQLLAQYVPSFHPSFLGLYGDTKTTERTAREFKVYFKPQPPNEHGNYTVDHSGQILVFDPAGRLRLLIRPEATPQSVAHDIRLLLQDSS
jgi:protein SCO1/2